MTGPTDVHVSALTRPNPGGTDRLASTLEIMAGHHEQSPVGVPSGSLSLGARIAGTIRAVFRGLHPRRRSVAAYQKMLVSSGAIKIAKDNDSLFQLRSGIASHVYVDHGEVICHPETNKVLFNAITMYIAHHFDEAKTILVNVDSKSSPQLTGAVATKLRYRQIVVIPDSTYLAERQSRLKLRLPHVNGDDKIVILDDVLTQNDTTALSVANLVRRRLRACGTGADSIEIHLVVGLNRDRSYAAQLSLHHNITVHSLTTLDEVLPPVLRTLADAQRRSIQREFGLHHT